MNSSPRRQSDDGGRKASFAKAASERANFPRDSKVCVKLRAEKIDANFYYATESKVEKS